MVVWLTDIFERSKLKPDLGFGHTGALQHQPLEKRSLKRGGKSGYE